MKITVVGAGQVGTAVAQGLDDDHEIVVVDLDAEKLDELRYSADVMTFEGDAADVDVLEEAGADESDMIIASTNNDRANILVCSVSEAIGDDVFSIARVADTDFLKSWRYARDAFHVDVMVGSDYLTAQSLVEIGLRRMAHDVEHFDRGRIEVVEFDIPADSEMAGKTVEEADEYPGLRYAAVYGANGETEAEVVRGDTRLPPGGRVLVIGRPSEVDKLARDLATSPIEPLDRIFILGGGEIGYQTARLLKQRDLTPKIVVEDRQRAEQLARNVPDSFVLHDDPTDPEFLRSEGIERAELVISTLSPDEKNFFASLQARELGADRVLSVVDEREFVSLFDAYGVDATVNPRNKVIEEILRHTRGQKFEKVALLEGQEGEVVEIELDTESPMVGKSLADAAQDLPREMMVGTLARGNQMIIPNGETVFNVGDRLVIYAQSDAVDELMESL